MDDYSADGAAVAGARASADGATFSSASASSGNAKELQFAFLWLGPGFLLGIVASGLYPLVDGAYLLWWVCLFALAPVMPRLWNAVRGRPLESTGRFPTAYLLSCAAFAIFAGGLLLNGALDKAPPNDVKTTVIRKVWVSGKSTSYHVTVASWRPDRSEEQLRVDGSVYNKAHVGHRITVEVHQGYFGLPWYGTISPD